MLAGSGLYVHLLAYFFDRSGLLRLGLGLDICQGEKTIKERQAAWLIYERRVSATHK